MNAAQMAACAGLYPNLIQTLRNRRAGDRARIVSNPEIMSSSVAGERHT